MAAALLVFVVVTGGILGGYFAVTALPRLLQQRHVDRRLRELSTALPAAPGDHASVVVRQMDGALPALDRLAEQTAQGRRLARLIEQSGVRTTPTRLTLMSIACAAGCGFAISMVVRVPVLPLLAAALGAFAPVVWLLRRRAARFKQFEEMFPEALDLLGRAVKAGHAFQSAMNMVAEELPDPVGPEFKKSFDQQNYGLPLRDALNSLAERVPIIDVRFFVTAVLIQRETGGNLSEILENLAHVVRERFKVLRQVRVHTAHGRFTGWVLMALPAGLAIVLSFLNPDHMNLLFREPMGHALLIGAVVMQIVGYVWIRQVIKIEV